MIDRELLAQALSELDAGTRALLDLSLRRAIPDDQVAAALGVDAASIPPRRARGIADLADKLEVPGPSELAALLLAIPELPDDAWAVPKGVPFSGKASRAGRARAFRRVAIAASPALALAAVIAALAVSSGSDQSIHGIPTGSSSAGGGGGGGGAPSAAAPALEPRHGLPDGAGLASAADHERRASHKAAKRRHHRARRHAASAPEHAIQARGPAVTPRSVPVVYNPPPSPAPEAPQPAPRHHHSPGPKSSPSPAPVQTPPVPVQTPPVPVPTPAPAPAPVPVSVPVSAPDDTSHTQQHSSLSAPVSSKPGKEYKPEVPQPDIHPYGDRGSHRGGGCDHNGWSRPDSDPGPDQGGDGGYSYRSSGRIHSGRQGFSPPGLFKKRYGPGRH